MDREEKIRFIIKAIEEVEGVRLREEYFADYSEAMIDDEVEWMEYLLTK